MKTLYCLYFTATLFLFTIHGFSQEVRFAYDAYGNRIQRLVVTKSLKSSSPDTTLIDNQMEENIEAQIGGIVIKVFPNPASDKVSINFAGDNTPAEAEYLLYSASGNLLERGNIIGIIGYCDLSKYSSGIYFLHISMHGKTEQWKIVKN